MTDQCQQLLVLPPRPNQTVSPHSLPGTTPTPTHVSRKCTDIGMAHANVTINMLPDDMLLEIFACHLHTHRESFTLKSLQMWEWQRLAHVCQRSWRQIIYASPRHLGLFIDRTSWTSVAKNLSCWPAFPIAITYQFGLLDGNEDEVVTLLEHSDRVRLVRIMCQQQELVKVVTEMQKPFPALTDLHLIVHLRPGPLDPVPALCSGFLGGSAPCLQRLTLHRIPFPALPTLLLSAHALVSLRLRHIPPTGYISPEAMVASLAVLPMLETLSIKFIRLTSTPPHEQRRRRPDIPMRALLPALTIFGFEGRNEYLEDFVAQIDAPRVIGVKAKLGRFNFYPAPQLFLFTGRIEHLRFRRVSLKLRNGIHGGEVGISLLVDPPLHGVEDSVSEPHFILSTQFSWSSTHLVHMLTQIFALCPNVDFLLIRNFDDHPGRPDYFDRTEWLAVFRLFPIVTTLEIYGCLAGQVSRALEDVPAEMVTDVLPSLHSLTLVDPEELASTTRFISLRELYGRPVTIP